MNSLKENAAVGLLVALMIGPSLSANPGLAMAVRLSSATLVTIGTSARWASKLSILARQALPPTRSDGSRSTLGKARSS